MQQLFREISFSTSRLITKRYSTSFSIAVSYLAKDIREGIYSIYGFVRLADEIVDSFLEYDRNKLLVQFERDYNEACENRVSINPVLNSFQETVRKFRIPDYLVRAFLNSMKADLVKTQYYSRNETDEYIYGSAEVVGMMCLMVFCNGDEKMFNELKEPAKKLGSAFQKVNFLRDMKDDMEQLDRYYFHQLTGRSFTDEIKNEIISDIRKDFRLSLPGIKQLPSGSKPGVLIAYYYYQSLLDRIERTPAKRQFEKRIRIPDPVKVMILGKALAISKLRII